MISSAPFFRAGVVERFGAVGDGLAGMIRQMVGDAARMGDEDDYSFTAQRMLAWAMQHVVFGAVMTPGPKRCFSISNILETLHRHVSHARANRSLRPSPSQIVRTRQNTGLPQRSIQRPSRTRELI